MRSSFHCWSWISARTFSERFGRCYLSMRGIFLLLGQKEWGCSTPRAPSALCSELRVSVAWARYVTPDAGYSPELPYTVFASCCSRDHTFSFCLSSFLSAWVLVT